MSLAMKRIFLTLAATALCAPLLASAAEGWVVADISLQAGPDPTYPSIVELRAGTPVYIEGCLDDWSWCDVVAYEDRGWVPGTFVEEEYQNGPVFIAEYGARIGIPIVTFSIGAYWQRHYHNRPFYAQRSHWESRRIRVHAPPRPARIVAPRPLERQHGPSRHDHTPAPSVERKAEPRSTQPNAELQRTQRQSVPEPRPRKPADASPQMQPHPTPPAEPPKQHPAATPANAKQPPPPKAKQHEPKPKDELKMPKKEKKHDNDNGGGGGR
jgi:uncharacterized protein YraI